MRKGITRDKVNRTFTRHTGKAEFYDRDTGKRVKKAFDIYTDRKSFDAELGDHFPENMVLLKVLAHEQEKVTFSMSPEDFRKYATIY